VPALGHKDICGLDVAVDDAFGVRGIQCVPNFDPQFQRLLQRQGLAGNSFLQRLTVETFHGNKRLAIVLADFVDGANVGMVQGGSGLCFAIEAGEGL
jgi:hypothetical protein